MFTQVLESRESRGSGYGGVPRSSVIGGSWTKKGVNNWLQKKDGRNLRRVEEGKRSCLRRERKRGAPRLDLSELVFCLCRMGWTEGKKL